MHSSYNDMLEFFFLKPNKYQSYYVRVMFLSRNGPPNTYARRRTLGTGCKENCVIL